MTAQQKGYRAAEGTQRPHLKQHAPGVKATAVHAYGLPHKGSHSPLHLTCARAALRLLPPFLLDQSSAQWTYRPSASFLYLSLSDDPEEPLLVDLSVSTDLVIVQYRS